MFKVVRIEEMREIEAAVNTSLFSYDRMMLNAGRAASRFLRERVDINQETRIAVLIGKGNNGGDGLVLARDLAQNTAAQIHLYLLEARDQADQNFAAAKAQDLVITLADQDDDLQLLTRLINSSDVVVDALFGIGLRLPLRGQPARILRAIRHAIQQRKAGEVLEQIAALTEPARTRPVERPFVLAIDCPSGINCDDGQADPNALAADATITFIAAKPGLLTFPAAANVGELALSTIGIPNDFAPLAKVKRTVTDLGAAKELLPKRPLDGHKGTFGKVMVVGGSDKYVGAIALAAEATYRVGAGLVSIATTTRLVDVIAGSMREPTFLPLAENGGSIAASSSDLVKDASTGYDALLIGCGLGRQASVQSFVTGLLAKDGLPPLIVDADALTIMGEIDRWWELLPAETIITPHPGEMARLCQISAAEVNADRWEIAAEYARAWNLTIVLKGAHTLIAAPDGSVAVIPFKTDALSTAGTGDVLAGMIAGLRAQGLSAFDSARLGAYTHALAATIAVEDIGSSRSVIAGDVLAGIGRAFERLEQR